jgi:hypothetical protein
MSQTALLAQIARKSLQVAAPLVGVGLVVVGLIVAGRLARERLRPLNRHAINFTEIDCNVPSGRTRVEFLTEVQYLANLPDRVQLLDDGLATRLATAFALHPRVAQVERVEILPESGVRVRLTFR